MPFGYNFIKPIIDATVAIEKQEGRDVAYAFAMKSVKKAQATNDAAHPLLSKLLRRSAAGKEIE